MALKAKYKNKVRKKRNYLPKIGFVRVAKKILIFTILLIVIFTVGELAVVAKAQYENLKQNGSLVIEEIDLQFEGNHEVKNVELKLKNFLGKNILAIDLEELGKDIENMAWIGSVQIRTELPGLLVAIIKERVAAAIIVADNGEWLIDKEGYLLDRADVEIDKKLLRIENIASKRNLKPKDTVNLVHTEMALDIFSYLKDYRLLGKHRIDSLNIADKDSIEISFEDSDALLLLPMDNYQKAIQEIAVVDYILRKEKSFADRLDFRFENKAIVVLSKDRK